MGLLLLSLLSEAGFSKVTCQHDTFVSPAPSSAPPPAPEAVLGSWRDLAETRGDVQAPSESHGTQHSSHGCALGESHGVCGGVQHVVTAPQCQLLWLFIISIFKKKKKKKQWFVCFPCASPVPTAALAPWGGGWGWGRTCSLLGSGYLIFLFPARVFLLLFCCYS